MILSGNSIEHLLLTLAAHTIGTPVLPVATAWAPPGGDHAALRAIADLVDPGLVFADDPQRYAAALRAVSASDRVLAAGPAAADGAGAGLPVVSFEELTARGPTGEVDERRRRVGPDTIAKILVTSGPAGRPRGVLHTHRMLCSNQQMLRQAWPFLAEQPPVLLESLPWSDTFGGNHNLNMVLVNGGTIWLDDGWQRDGWLPEGRQAESRPTGDLVDRTLRNLAEAAPNVHVNVPAGLSVLAPALEADRKLARRVLRRLRLVVCAGAAPSRALWARIEALAASVGEPVPVTTSWGTTETAPAVTSAHFDSPRPDCVGVPLSGMEVKLAPVGGRQEIRVRGPNITPGYRGDPAATAAAFDDERYYRTGHAARLVDPSRPDAGLVLDGPIAAD